MIVVLAPDVPGPALERLCGDWSSRGWTVDSSQGAENTVLLVSGPTSVEELARSLAGLEADVLSVLEPEQYRRQHRNRRFLARVIGGLTILVSMGLLIPIWSFLKPPQRTVVAPELVHVPGAGALPVGGTKALRIQGSPVLVVRLAPHRWHAVSASCTYMERCLLEWSVEQQRLVCACHGCTFDAYGNVLHAPASMPLTTYAVVESGSEIYIRRMAL